MAINVDLLVRLTVFVTLLTLLFSRHVVHVLGGIVWLLLAFGHAWPLLDLVSVDSPSSDTTVWRIKATLDLPILRTALSVITLLGCLMVVVHRRRYRST